MAWCSFKKKAEGQIYLYLQVNAIIVSQKQVIAASPSSSLVIRKIVIPLPRPHKLQGLDRIPNPLV